MQLQRNSTIEIHDTVWESLVGINIIKKYFKKAKTKYI